MSGNLCSAPLYFWHRVYRCQKCRGRGGGLFLLYIWVNLVDLYTRKNLTPSSKSANNSSTSCVALLVPSCQQVWNKPITTCSNLVDIIRPVSQRPRLYLPAPACLIMPSSLLQIVNSLFQTCSAVASSLIGVAHIHIFVFTNHKNNRFQKKLITQNTNTTLLYLRNCQWLVVSHREVFWTRYFSVFMWMIYCQLPKIVHQNRTLMTLNSFCPSESMTQTLRWLI
jgi:hypothetical protein